MVKIRVEEFLVNIWHMAIQETPFFGRKLFRIWVKTLSLEHGYFRLGDRTPLKRVGNICGNLRVTLQ
jgi:hypothetical protein